MTDSLPQSSSEYSILDFLKCPSCHRSKPMFFSLSKQGGEVVIACKACETTLRQELPRDSEAVIEHETQMN